ncbi:Molybdopterin binding protein [Coemansia reversa NRRL 1564]|uniref:Molybdopterin binding protein n=1 Tax=Coemansia reversa (strain ATCC 12441 / NRRL 1564) TaxID=763665 RepID=A0A2G5BJQ6_COERN|nr:Molybdopterin binding protein [Coemansia reversa NRRL 1564]|eukprot:PIA19264.1 Molybdopterin binding protein [Coemansia reversa NRRL 1564]
MLARWQASTIIGTRPFKRWLTDSAAKKHHSAGHLTAAFCAIGNEILNGKVLDVNSHLFARRCFELGVSVQRIEVVPDQSDEIGRTVKQLAQKHQIVFTSGGIGPTHDDITYSAVADAFNSKMTYHLPTLDRMRRIMQKRGVYMLPNPHGSADEVACARMALLPDTAQVSHPCEELWVPVVCMGGNVHVLPGIPGLFERLLDAYLPELVERLAGQRPRPFVRALVATHLRESVIAPVLEELQRRYAKHGIQLGSYPDWTPQRDAPGKDRRRVVLSAVGSDREHVEACQAELCRRLSGTPLD